MKTDRHALSLFCLILGLLLVISACSPAATQPSATTTLPGPVSAKTQAPSSSQAPAFTQAPVATPVVAPGLLQQKAFLLSASDWGTDYSLNQATVEILRDKTTRYSVYFSEASSGLTALERIDIGAKNYDSAYLSNLIMTGKRVDNLPLIGSGRVIFDDRDANQAATLFFTKSTTLVMINWAGSIPDVGPLIPLAQKIDAYLPYPTSPEEIQLPNPKADSALFSQYLTAAAIGPLPTNSVLAPADTFQAADGNVSMCLELQTTRPIPDYRLSIFDPATGITLYYSQFPQGTSDPQTMQCFSYDTSPGEYLLRLWIGEAVAKDLPFKVK